MVVARTARARRFPAAGVLAVTLTAAAVAALALAAGGTVLAAVAAGSRSPTRPRAAPSAPHALSAAAAMRIAARIGVSDPAFAVRRGRTGFTLRGGGVGAVLTPGGARISGLTVALAGLGRGRRLAPLGAPAMSARGNRVSYRYPDARAW